MSKPDLDASALTDAIGSRAAVDDRAQRVRWIGEAARALIRGEVLSTEPSTFVGTALLAWLQRGARCNVAFAGRNPMAAHSLAHGAPQHGSNRLYVSANGQYAAPQTGAWSRNVRTPNG